MIGLAPCLHSDDDGEQSMQGLGFRVYLGFRVQGHHLNPKRFALLL